MKYWSVILSVLISACSKNEKAPNRFGDSNHVTIANLSDRRAGDSLLFYLRNENPDYRQSAALAFASIQDSNFVEPLNKLMVSDNVDAVRSAAAFAIGQTPSIRSERALSQAAASEKSTPVLGEIIQAYGKVARSWKLSIAPSDTVISTALAWGYYRMAVRGLGDTVLNKKSSEFLQSQSTHTRLAAAHYFARGAKNFEKFSDQLIHAAREKSPLVRMAASQALGKIPSDPSLNALLNISRTDPDYRVRINATRSLQNFRFDQVKETLLNALADSNVNVGISAAEIIRSTLTIKHWNEVLSVARNATNWRIKANLFGAALFASSSEKVAAEIREAFEKSANPYEQAALLTELQHAPSNAEFLHQQLMQSKQPVIKSSAALALVAINKNEKFDHSSSPAFARYYEQAISDGDMAVIGIVCSALADSALNYKAIIKDLSFLKRAKDKLSLPRDYESVVPLNMAINYFEGRNQTTELENDFNHPIDWNLVKKIPVQQQAIIKTSRGNIAIKLFIEEAPGSVANFVWLAKSNYYNGKRIHRVAPNFVVQAGCPRGDGWGSEDYSIRSEFSQHSYATGSIGMASAGRDTEGTQWFITHSPTPHLEGRYTLFAEVVTGMETVHKLEIGDTITAIDIIDFDSL